MNVSTETIDVLKRRLYKLQEIQAPWHAKWKEIRDYMLPTHGRFDGELDNDGRKKHDKIVDSTPLRSVTTFSAGMQNGLTPPSMAWFRLMISDSDLMDYDPVKQYLHRNEELMRHVHSISNFYNAAHHTYAELGTFSTGAMGLFENYETAMCARSFTIGEYYIATNHLRQVDTFYRVFNLNVSAIIGQFGLDNVSIDVKTAYDRNEVDKEFEIVHAIEPNDDRIELKDIMKRKFRSVYFEKNASDKVLSVSGYDEFPILCPRWDTAGADIYGSGLGDNALADVKMLQRMQTKSINAVDKLIDPPLAVPTELKGKIVNTYPGGLNFIDVAGKNNLINSLYNVQIDLNHLENKIEKTADKVKKGFFEDLFLMLNSYDKAQPLTAYEVMLRNAEKMQMLGPAIDNMYNEMLNPAIDRTFEILSRARLLPPPPRELQGMTIKVEYISVLAQAQKMSKIQGIQQLVSFVGGLAQAKPDVLDKIDLDEAIDQYANTLGVPPKLVVSDENVQKIRQARAQQQAQMQQMAQLQQGVQTAGVAAQGAKALADSDMSGNNALKALLSGVKR